MQTALTEGAHILVTADLRDSMTYAAVLDGFTAVPVGLALDILCDLDVESVTVTELANVHPGAPAVLEAARGALAARGREYVHTVIYPPIHLG